MAQLDNRCPHCFAQLTAPGPCPQCGRDAGDQNAMHQLQVGTVLHEQYLVGRVLGQGGFGITYLGWDLYLDIPVAIKEYYPSGMVMRESAVTMQVSDVTGDDGARFRNNRERFMREAKMLARFAQIREIVQIKNFFLANNTAYIVMEYVEGITLKQHVKQSGGKLSAEETFLLLTPIIEALGKVHKAGIVHRDISPDNIMLLPGGGAKLLDFGAVRDVGAASVDKELTKSTEAILKQGYAPIEQYQKKGALGPWTDVYALCATIFYCITGEVPPDSPARVLDYEELDISRAEGLSDAQRAALEHGMELRAEKRIGSMEQLYQELFMIPLEPQPEPEEIPLSERPDSLPEKEKTAKRESVTAAVAEPSKAEEPPKSKPKWPLIALIMAVVVIAALVLILALGGREDSGIPADPTEPTQTEAAIQELASGTCGDDLTWTLNGLGELRITGSGEMPAVFENGSPWQEYQPHINHVVFEGENITIASDAFQGCAQLLSLDLGGAVTYIGDNAFAGAGLTEVAIPDSVAFIGNGAFACEGLTTVTLGEYTRLCYDELNNTWSTPIFGTNPELVLKGYSGGMAEDYANIVGYAFEAIGKAQPEGRGAIGDDITWWFDRETGFLKIAGNGWMGFYSGSYVHQGSNTYGNDNEIPWAQFREEIRTVSIGDGILSSVPANVFENHVNLDDVYFGKNIQAIDQYAFANTGIDWLHLPDTITDIRPYAFAECQSLRHLVLPLDVNMLEPGAFDNCVNIRDFYPGNTYIGYWDLQPTQQPRNLFNAESNDKSRMPQNMTVYIAGEYTGHEKFAEFFGYQTAQGVDGRSFFLGGECGSSVYWRLEDDTLYLYGKGGTHFFNNNASATNAWNDGTTQSWWRDDPSFYPYRSDVVHIVIEPGVTDLNEEVFKDMENLKTVEFGTVERIYSSAFVNCGMEEITVPATVHTIQSLAFENCPNLRRLEIYGGTRHMGELKAVSPVLEEVYFHADADIGAGVMFFKVLDGVHVYAPQDSMVARRAQEQGYENLRILQ